MKVAKAKKATFAHKARLNFHIVYKIDLWPRNLDSWFTLLNSSFGAVKLTKNVDADKHSYFGYGIGFDTRSAFSMTDNGGIGKNVIIFDHDMNSTVHTDSRKCLNSW